MPQSWTLTSWPGSPLAPATLACLTAMAARRSPNLLPNTWSVLPSNHFSIEQHPHRFPCQNAKAATIPVLISILSTYLRA